MKRMLAAFALVLAACSVELPTTVNKAEAQTRLTMPDSVWHYVKTECRWCHIQTPYPSDVDLRTRTSVWDYQMAMFGNGVAQGLAPFIVGLQPSVRDTMVNWVKGRGYTVPVYSIPQTYTFDLNDWMADKQDGSIPPGWFFTVEDGWIDGANVNGGASTHRWRIEPHTDSHGTMFRALTLNQNRTTNPDSFPGSINSSVYGVLGHQRFKDGHHNYTIEYDIAGLQSGRWASIYIEAQELKPTGRDNRDYVRFQGDRDAWSIRSVPSDVETWPWGGSAASPGADELLVGELNASGFFLSNDWYHVVLTSERRTIAGGFEAADTLGTLYTMTVTNPYTRTVVADLWGIAVDDTTSQGSWGFHKYAFGSKKIAWANLRVRADIATTNWRGVTTPSGRRRTPPQMTDPRDGDDTNVEPPN